MYAFVINNQIQGLGDPYPQEILQLPLAEQIQQGYYPLIEEDIPNYNDLTHELERVEIINADNVTVAYNVVELSSQQQQERLDNAIGNLGLRVKNLLLESDFTQLSDSPYTPEQKNLWASYRQTLRGLTTIALSTGEIPEIPEPPQI